jgi:CubicO group peptidase (beta-lactamase class C family)
MWRARLGWLFACCLLAACDKPPLIKFPGESAERTAANTAPIVKTGDAITIKWPQAEVELVGEVADDGLPANETLRTGWTSARGDVEFASPLAPRTIARFRKPGAYTLTLYAHDGALQTSATVLVTVSAANEGPTADAGPDQTTELPFEVALQGSAADNGAPQPLAVQWSVESGPGAVTFADAARLDTSAMFTAAGVYTLRLTVSDGELSSADVTSVTVHPAVYPAPDLTDADPDRGWLRVTPDAVGMNASALDPAVQYAVEAGGAGLIVRKGRLVRSWGNIDQRFDLKSTTKSIAAITLAIALDEGKVGLGDAASTLLPGFGQPPDNDPQQLASITLRQLATHTSGFEKTGGYGRLIAQPGAAWIYSDGALNWLADVLTNVYGHDLHDIFVNRIWPVLGVNVADDIRWRLPSAGMRPDPRPSGILHREFAAGFIGNANTMGRVGLLYLRRGAWAGQQLFSPSFADLVRSPHPDTAAAIVAAREDHPEANLRYGLLWWTNATGALAQVPRDAYWAWGLGDSLIVVIPSLDLVIARAGPIRPVSPGRRELGDSDWTSEYDVLEPFLNPIVQAVTRVGG